MQTTFRPLIAVVALALLSLAAAGCQTTKGLGKDVERLGENIQDGAKK